MRDELSSMFTPSRVAVIGATDRDGSVGRALMENLSSFEGEVIPINPNRESVFGKTCYPEIAEVPEGKAIDLAIVVVPSDTVNGVVRQLGMVGIVNVVVITAGFAESNAEGKKRERELASIANEHDLNLVGPNCVGIINTQRELNATFAKGTPEKGSISLLSQSGAFIAAVLAWTADRGIGFKDIASLGNEAVLDETEFISAWADDPDTKVILAYIEDIDQGEAFMETARRVTKETPIVVIKSGRTEAGAEAAASHTGSLAGRDQAYNASFQQVGAIRATNIQEVFDFGQVLAGQPLLEHDEVAIITNGGGPGILATDAVGDSQLNLTEFDDALSNELMEFLPEQADAVNPLDIIGDADIDRFDQALHSVLRTPSVAGAVVLSFPTLMLDVEELAETIRKIQQEYNKPIVTCLMGGAEASRAAKTLSSVGIPNYFDPARAVSSLEVLVEYREFKQREYQSPKTFEVDQERAEDILMSAVEREVDHLSVEAMELLDAYDIPMPVSEVVDSVSAAEAVAKEIGEPVVMKIVSPDILHKSDIGGVRVGVPTGHVKSTYHDILEQANNHDPDAEILGVQIQEAVDLPESTETIVGVSYDSQFGHLVMFGLGGIFVEIFGDTSFRIAPISEQEAREMTGEIHAAPMLRGARGRSPADIDSIVETIQRVSQLVFDFPSITELDINPLVVSPEGVSAIDLRLSIDREKLLSSA